jgi:hypothetical protein
LTFLFEPRHFPIFFGASGGKEALASLTAAVDFQQATMPFLCRCFGMSEPSYISYHTRALDLMRGKLLPSSLEGKGTGNALVLREAFNEELKTHWGDSGVHSLFELVKETAFAAR